MDKILKKAIDLNGKKNQLGVVQEECAELVQAISKFFRNKAGSREMVIEEAADVKIMLRQIELIFDCEAEIGREVERKLARLDSRLDQNQKKAA